MRKYFITLSLSVLAFITTASAQERYSYKVKYGFITAGSARLEFNNVNELLASRFSIESSRWLSRLWKMDDSIESSYDILSGRLLTHNKRIREGKYKRDYRAQFNWDDSLVMVNQDTTQLINAHLLDIPSLLHQMRRISLTVGDTLVYDLFDGHSVGRLSLHIQKMERIEVSNRKIQAFILRPLERNDKAEANKLYLSIWLSATTPHIPIQLSIQTRYGDAVMTLETD